MCGIIGFISRKKRLISGDKIAIALDSLKERGNGQGSGYVGYGIYPKFKDSYAIHVFLDNSPDYDRIRERVKKGLSITGLVFPEVEAYIKSRNLYKQN